MSPESPESATHAIALRVRRVTVEDAYIAVPVTEAVTRDNGDATQGIDPDAFFAEAIRLSADARVEWVVETTDVQPHPEQGPVPQGRHSFDPHLAGKA